MAADGSYVNSLRIPRERRGNSVTSSARSSAFYDDYRAMPPPPLPGTTAASAGSGPGPSHGLRTVDSRFSLNEHFAASRREYEFGFDDAASSMFFDRVTAADDDEEDADADDGFGDKTLTEEDFTAIERKMGFPAIAVDDLDGDYYDTLCLPGDAQLSTEQVRRAYYRLFVLFYPNSYPESLRAGAKREFSKAQEAFETIIDPERRARYDVGRAGKMGQRNGDLTYDEAFQEATWRKLLGGVATRTDLGLRLDATKAVVPRRAPLRKRCADVQALDFTLGQSLSVNIPALRNAVTLATHPLRQILRHGGFSEDDLPRVTCSVPQISIHGAVYGITKDMVSMPMALVSDRYQPLLPAMAPKWRLLQLVENKLAPLMGVGLRQEFTNASLERGFRTRRWEKTSVEVETEALPEPAVEARLYHHVDFPKTFPDMSSGSAADSQSTPSQTVFETTVRSSRYLKTPKLALGVQHRLRHGTGFARADSGDWSFKAGDPYRFLSGSPGRKMVYAEFPILAAPSAEVGFTTAIADHGPRVLASPELPRSECGLIGLDQDTVASKGSWTVSLASSLGGVIGYVRYSKNLLLRTKRSSTTAVLSRIELELCTSTLRDRYLALRHLWPVTRLSRLGVEVGVSNYSVHLSVYWSRLGQRLSLPILIAPAALATPPLLFAFGALPLIGLATTQIWRRERRHISHSSFSEKKKNPRQLHDAPKTMTKADLQAIVARHRREADQLTGLLAQQVDARQKRRAAHDGLVILSAKYGMPKNGGQDDDDRGGGGWADGEEIADVTVAIAALVDDGDEEGGGGGRLHIPRGVRKGRIPGFWDPAPGWEKMLMVRYAWRGTETTVKVYGNEALVLPP